MRSVPLNTLRVHQMRPERDPQANDVLLSEPVPQLLAGDVATVESREEAGR